jgi:hypothetical protein
VGNNEFAVLHNFPETGRIFVPVNQIDGIG